MSDPIVQGFRLGPGGVIVVGPMGFFELHLHASGSFCHQSNNCDVISADEHMSEAHRNLVDECWAKRTEDGAFLHPAKPGEIRINPREVKHVPEGDWLPPSLRGKITPQDLTEHQPAAAPVRPDHKAMAETINEMQAELDAKADLIAEIQTHRDNAVKECRRLAGILHAIRAEVAVPRLLGWIVRLKVREAMARGRADG